MVTRKAEQAKLLDSKMDMNKKENKKRADEYWQK